jgi:hypothetical protein
MESKNGLGTASGRQVDQIFTQTGVVFAPFCKRAATKRHDGPPNVLEVDQPVHLPSAAIFLQAPLILPSGQSDLVRQNDFMHHSPKF